MRPVRPVCPSRIPRVRFTLATGPARTIGYNRPVSSASRISRIGLVVKRDEPRAEPVVGQLLSWTGSHGIEVLTMGDKSDSGARAQGAADIVSRSDLLVVLGGDGTMLGAARMLGERATPVLGVNFGTLGYLTEFTVDTMFPALEAILDGDFELDSRVTLTCEVERRGRLLERTTAINDAVVNTSALARMIEVDCWIDGRFVTYFRADGLIVSTPTGSTAYNLSAGGPILMPSMGAFVISPICPHTLSNRPLVVPDSVTIELSLRPTAEPVTLTVDGQMGINLAIHDRVRLRKSAATFNLITPRDRNYFEVLRGKLRWGGRIDGAGT